MLRLCVFCLLGIVECLANVGICKDLMPNCFVFVQLLRASFILLGVLASFGCIYFRLYFFPSAICWGGTLKVSVALNVALHVYREDMWGTASV